LGEVAFGGTFHLVGEREEGREGGDRREEIEERRGRGREREKGKK
jgi:hypothetical protein